MRIGISARPWLGWISIRNWCWPHPSPKAWPPSATVRGRTTIPNRPGPGWVPDVILMAQSRPGQISPRQVEQLHAASPLSRLVVLAGSWCEGELRSGRPCTGVIRVLWHQWQPRLIPFLQPGSAAVPGLWQMPRTASLDERLASTVGSWWPRREGLVAIHADGHETFAALSEACHAGGYATVWYLSEESVAASGVVAALGRRRRL